MNMDSSKEPLKTPSQDAQGRWYDLLSPTQVLTGQEQITTTTTISKKRKKQSRNRKLQRHSRKLRKQG
ncbi:unnamed protein product, partial [Rotaria sp. Silwood2]